jgi:DNA polymerase III gamma/tau subunit
VEATAEVRKQMEAHAKSFSTPDVLRIIKTFNAAAADLRGSWQPSLNLELALAEAMEAPAETVSSPVAPSRPKMQSTPAPKKADDRKTEVVPSGKAEGADPPVVSAGEVIKVWKPLIAALPKSQANLAALLNSVKVIEVHGKTLILGFASDVLVSKMDKPDQIEAAQKAITEALGVELDIRCGVTSAKGKVPAGVPQDGMVATAIQHGGEIVDVQD